MSETKQFTRSEVEKGNGKGKTLIILHDQVYDVARFLNEHPGGEEILLEHGGRDGSEDFDDVGHSKDAFELMKNYLVGELVESERSNKSPKKGWVSGYSKQMDTKQDSPMSTYITILSVFFLLYAAYYMYL